MNKTKIINYFSGNYTNDNRLYVEELFRYRKSEKELKEFLEEHWNSLFEDSEVPEKNLDHVFKDLLKEIEQEKK